MLTYSFEDRQGKSKFEYLYEQIREDILKGTLKPGEKLPSKRALAEHLGISVITVEGAYGQLLDEGYIVSRPRSGFFVSEISLPSGSIAPDIPQTVELQNVGSGRLPREETTGMETSSSGARRTPAVLNCAKPSPPIWNATGE